MPEAGGLCSVQEGIKHEERRGGLPAVVFFS